LKTGDKMFRRIKKMGKMVVASLSLLIAERIAKKIVKKIIKR